MRLLLVLCLTLVTGQASAQQAMVALDCDRAMLGFAEGFVSSLPIGDTVEVNRHTVNADGWCEVDFDEGPAGGYMAWRATDLAANAERGQWPEQIEFRIQDRVRDPSDPADQLRSIQGTLTYFPPAKSVTLVFTLDFVGDASIIGTVEFKGFDGSSASSMRLSVGSIRVMALRAIMNASGEGAETLWYRLFTDQNVGADINPDRASEVTGVVTELLQVLPTEIVPADSQAAIARFFADWPSNEGELSLFLTSETGVGIYQFSGAIGRISSGARSFEPLQETEDFVRSLLMPAVEILLHGVEIEVTWDPA